MLALPLPQLFPHLNQCLHLSRSGQAIVDQSAIFKGALVKLTHAIWTEVREIVAKLLEFFFR